jgi:hypothetical protein
MRSFLSAFPPIELEPVPFAASVFFLMREKTIRQPIGLDHCAGSIHDKLWAYNKPLSLFSPHLLGPPAMAGFLLQGVPLHLTVTKMPVT